ncbi:MAG: LysR family transcriptional regulator [Gammaproteobacteria bacterium]
MKTEDLILFVRTADSGSITRAAEQLDITTAAASAALKRLERQLETVLFIRTTRQLRITAQGERFLVYCREALSQLKAGKESLQAMHGKVAGELRISAPSDLGRNVLLGWLDEIMDQHAGLSINLILGDNIADFYLDRVDLAIRYGTLEDSSMVAFKLATVDGGLFASPSYLAKYGAPQEPDDLKSHNCLLYNRNNRPYDGWEFLSDEEGARTNKIVRVSGKQCSNDSEIVRRWAVAGKGIAYKSRIEMEEDVCAGRLIRVLPEFQLRRNDLNLICPSREQISPVVLIIRDLVREKFSLLLASAG